MHQPGIFRLEKPASLLFKDFEDLSQRLTRHYYQNEVGLELVNATLVDNLVITGQAEQVGSENEAIDWLTANMFHFHRLITLSQSEITATTEEPAVLRISIAEQGATLTTTIQSFAETSEQLDTLLKSQAILRARFEIDPAAVGVSGSDAG